MTTSILVAGVATAWLDSAKAQGIDIGERNESAKIKGSAQTLQQDLKHFKNTTFHVVFLHPGDAANWEEFVAALKKQKWDCISFGGGVRTIPELGEYFTELIHVAKEEQPQARFVFPLLPEDVTGNIKKYVPGAN